MQNDSIKTVFLTGNQLDSVLFKAAIHYATAGSPVWFISCTPFEKIPDHIAIPEKEVLNLITFIYLRDYQSLIKHLNGIHLWTKTPRIILLSGFEEYANIPHENYESVCAALVSTSLLDASSSAAKCLKKKILLIISSRIVEERYDDRVKTLTEFYFPNVHKHVNDTETMKILTEFDCE